MVTLQVLCRITNASLNLSITFLCLQILFYTLVLNILLDYSKNESDTK